MPNAIAIDLGTTYSSVAIWQNDKVEVIANDKDSRLTPSYVAFTDAQHFIGEDAKIQLSRNPRNTIFDAKRLIGRRFNSQDVQSDMKYWPFEIVDKGGKPAFKLEFENEVKTLMPQEVLSMVIAKMRETAEAYLGCKIENAIITVPVHFNYSQRQAIRDAGLIAGLNVLRLVTETTAAAVAYSFRKKIESEKKVLIFDLGGGVCNVSLIMLEDDVIQVIAVEGNIHLGGEDFDNRLVDHFILEFKRKYKKDLSTNIRALQRLRNACECAKRTLSSSTRANIEIDTIFEGLDYYTSITRARFEELCQDLFDSIVEPIDKVLRDSRMDKRSVDEIVLVGGSTRIPRIQELIREFFDGKELNKSMNQDEAVVYGAALQAAVLSGDTSQDTDFLCLDVASFSLGIETEQFCTAPILKKNSYIPTQISQTFHFSNQPNVFIQVFEGERSRTTAANFLSKFELTDILPTSQNGFDITITFDVDANGILTVTAYERSTCKSKTFTITNEEVCLSKEEIGRLAQNVEKYKAKTDAEKNRIIARNSAERYTYELRDAFNKGMKYKDKIDLSDKRELETAIYEMLFWLDRNTLASLEEIESKEKELQAVANRIIFNFLKASS